MRTAPLVPGTTSKVISANIDRLMRTHEYDDNPKVAQAIAYKQAGRSGRRRRSKP